MNLIPPDSRFHSPPTALPLPPQSGSIFSLISSVERDVLCVALQVYKCKSEGGAVLVSG